jgi:hypothetical protein
MEKMIRGAYEVYTLFVDTNRAERRDVVARPEMEGEEYQDILSPK